MQIKKEFIEIRRLIQQARYNALKSVNSELINLYWKVGEYISKKVEKEEWGSHTIEKLADYIKRIEPEIRGFNKRGLFRMKQFYETYKGNTKVSTLLTQLPWSSHLHILSKTKSIQEKEFYINLAIKEKYSVRELERQIDSCVYERMMLSNKKVSTVLRENNPNISKVFKDTYILDFLNLPENFSEKDFRKAIIQHLKNFILEFGKDFSFIGEEYRIQVGNNDYYA